MGEYTINIYKQQFTQAELLRAINAPFKAAGEEGLSQMTLNNWVKRGHLPKLTEHAPGSGKRRLFSALDAIQIAALMYMTGLKIPVSDASNLLYFFREHMANRTLPGPEQQMGGMTLFLMAKPDGQLLVKSLRERGLDGNPVPVDFLENLPGFICLSVDFIIDVVSEQLSKVLSDSGESGEQEDDGAAFDLEVQTHWQKVFSASVIELEELEETLNSENREPTDEERKHLFELKRNIEYGKSVLKSRMGRKE